MNEKRFTLGLGDTLMLLSTVTTAFNILVTDYYSTRVDCVKLSCLQLTVCGVLSLATALLFEKPTMTRICTGVPPSVFDSSSSPFSFRHRRYAGTTRTAIRMAMRPPAVRMPAGAAALDRKSVV